MATDLKKDLQAVNRELKSLTKKVEKLVAAAGKAAKPKPAKKRAGAKKAGAKRPGRPPGKKAKAKKAAPKKAGKVTAIDAVNKIIQRSTKGVGVAALNKKTGFSDQKIYGIVKVLKKKGMIKSERMGLYVKA